jgi:hypothetical protein
MCTSICYDAHADHREMISNESPERTLPCLYNTSLYPASHLTSLYSLTYTCGPACP